MAANNNAQYDGVEQFEMLEIRVRSWKKWVSGIAVCLVGAYLIYFGLVLGQNPAVDSDKWGTFGDFVGGVMNPIVAFAAFFWLTESVKIQKQELADTRRELASATDAQNLLVKNGRESVRLAAITALLNVNNTKIDQIYKKLSILDAHIAEAGANRRAERELQQQKYGMVVSEYFSSKDTAVLNEKEELGKKIQELESRGEELQRLIEEAIAKSIS